MGVSIVLVGIAYGNLNRGERGIGFRWLLSALLRCSYNLLIFMNLIFLLGTILDEISP